MVLPNFVKRDNISFSVVSGTENYLGALRSSHFKKASQYDENENVKK